MKKIAIIFFAFLLATTYSKGQNCINCNGSNSLELTTGLNTSGTLIPMPTTATGGVTDPFWQLINVAPPSTNGSGGILIPNAYTIMFGTPAWSPAWLNIPGAQALSLIQNHNFSTNNSIASQPWKFVRKFLLCKDAQVHFVVDHIGDDVDTLKIYNSTGALIYSSTGLGHSTVKHFDVTLDMKAGCSKIVVDLINVGAVLTGFSVKANLTVTNNSLSNPNLVCCNNSIISGQKIIDNNCDGIFNSGDVPGIGWTFNLMNGSTIVQTAITDINGEFTFFDVPNGTYSVNEVIQTGYTPKTPISGQQTVTITQGNSVTNIQFLNCKNSNLPTCSCGQWGSIGYTLNNNGNKFSCNNGSTTVIQANQGDIFSLFPNYTCNGATVAQPCIAEFKYDVYFPNGGVLHDVKNIKDKKLDSCGLTRVVMTPYCGGVACPPCEFTINVNCCSCAQTLSPFLLWFEKAPSGAGQTKRMSLTCGETYTDKLDCFKTYYLKTVNPCGENCTPDEYITTIKFTPAVGSGASGYTTTGSTLIANIPGKYEVTIKVKCNGVWCKECKITFIQTKKCEPPCDNCKDKVQVRFDPAPSTATPKMFPATTSINAAFLLGGGTDTYTQVRFNVVDVQLSSDNPLCLQCYNTPNQWGSITGGSLTGFTPTVTNYSGVGTLNPNNNPREIVFNAATPTAVTNFTGMNINLTIPGYNPISCCCIKIVVFVKVTFRNNKCEECSKTIPIEITECPPNANNPNGSGTTITQLTGQPQFKQHAPDKDDVNKTSETEQNRIGVKQYY